LFLEDLVLVFFVFFFLVVSWSEGVLQIPAIHTANAIQSGFILSVLGNLKSFFDLAWSKSKDLNIILSGGDAELIYQHLTEDLKRHATIKKDLVLEGLFVLANR